MSMLGHVFHHVSAPSNLGALPITSNPHPLQHHLGQCAAAGGGLHRLRGAAEAVHAFLSPRFVSTLAILALLSLALVSFAA